jgi:integrase/recombinase XerD
VRAFPIEMPSGLTYWTVLDNDLEVVTDADRFLRQVRLGRDGAELTTRTYAGALALYLRWCDRTGRDWRTAAADMGLFITWLRHAPKSRSGPDPVARGAELLAGPGIAAVRGARRINLILTVVRAFLMHGVTTGRVASEIVPMLYEVGDSRDLPVEAQREDGRLVYRMRAHHRLSEPKRPVDRATDDEVIALLRACRSCRDRLIVLLMARSGLRRGELVGLRREDIHFMVDSTPLGCRVPLHRRSGAEVRPQPDAHTRSRPAGRRDGGAARG